MKLEFTVPCLFGLEGLVADELRRMSLENVRAENGRVRFSGTEADMARANIRLRCGERVLVELGRFPADTFDRLFEGTRALPWESLIPRDAAFPVKGHSLDSALHSIPDCQRIIKKAVVERLRAKYGVTLLPESAETYQIQFAIMKDEAVLYIDTTGDGLFKRGYRPAHGVAPLRETLAAGMVNIARYRGRDDFCDPFCGSGTIAIEAALAAKNRAPGLKRAFTAETWRAFAPSVWETARAEAAAAEFSGEYRIFASDIDPAAVEMARANAIRAGVEDVITFETADARQFARQTERGVIVTNPPYGERMLEKQQAEELYTGFGAAMAGASGWGVYVISSHPDFERFYGRRADKKRKLYNGMIKCELFMFTK